MAPAAIANPLSEKFAVLRPSMLPGLIDSCSHNRRRGRKDVRLFETGSRFTQEGEGRAVAFAWSGERTPTHWSSPPRAVDFFDIKGAVEVLGDALGVEQLEFSDSAAPFLVRGRSANVKSGGISRPDRSARIRDQRRRMASLPAKRSTSPRSTSTRWPSVAPGDLRSEALPKFPSIVRDLSILVAEALPAAAVRGTIRSTAPSTLQSVVEFDRYQGKGIPEGRLSLSLRLTFRSPERTLTDDEVDAAMNDNRRGARRRRTARKDAVRYALDKARTARLRAAVPGARCLRAGVGRSCAGHGAPAPRRARDVLSTVEGRKRPSRGPGRSPGQVGPASGGLDRHQ